MHPLWFGLNGCDRCKLLHHLSIRRFDSSAEAHRRVSGRNMKEPRRVPTWPTFFTSFFHSSFFVPLSNSFELHLSNTMHNDQLKSTGARNNSQPCENPCSTWKWHCLNHVQLQSSIFNVYIRVESEWQKEIAQRPGRCRAQACETLHTAGARSSGGKVVAKDGQKSKTGKSLSDQRCDAKRPTYADAPWDKCWTLSSRGLDRVASAASSFFTSQAKSDQVWSTRSTYCNATAISYQLPTNCTKKILAFSDLHVSLHMSLCPACLHCHLQLHKRRLIKMWGWFLQSLLSWY